MTYRVAVIGGGGIAVKHLQAMKSTRELEPVALAEIDEGRAGQLAQQFGIRAYTDYREMVKQERPDITIVTLPHFLHKDAAVFCAREGCHVLLEKPMAMSVSECDDIIEAIEASGVQLLVGHTQHYFPENQKAKELIESGELGRLVMINDIRHVPYFRPDRPAWFFEKAKAGGGILTNLGSHSIDKFRWLGGSPVTGVRASVSYFGNRGDIEGSGIIFLENADGLPATISQSGYGGVSKNETELIFTGGMAKLVIGQGLWISRDGAFVPVPVEAVAEPFVLQFRDLITSIETGRQPECSMYYSREIVEVVEAVYQSHEQKREIVLASSIGSPAD
ncbi:Gfo/Idh/MocA family protein [Paenibacillus sp. J2TS4]|uniref:Gfo/Idh/MocA family protein n=1 Tax=Paenibacillus sp. J2TS4 TaxID=2807194 RepID=UPI001B28A128|nr:Gfo/Idh/MocA family oxidoreductase [Paenibacillus sp. J2TS4]GIP35300.1 hypothetical protein J2TS4_45100 [Paenibacillus sp. J2TS4]